MTSEITLSEIIEQAKSENEKLRSSALANAIVALETWRASCQNQSEPDWLRVDGATLHSALDKVEEAVRELRASANQGGAVLMGGSYVRKPDGTMHACWGPLVYWTHREAQK